jgi:single-strand DNA-binding protein
VAEGLNKVMLLGNLGADPELRVTAGGQAILKLRLATTESYLDKSNTRQERTEWHSVTLWGKRGEALSKILAKGDRIFVEGGLRTSTYEKNGEKRYRTEVTASNVILSGRGRAKGDDHQEAPSSRARAGNGDGEGGGGGGRSRAPAPVRDAPEEDFGGSGYGGSQDDDIPF